MEREVVRKLTLLCVGCGLAGVVLMGVMALRDGKREWKQYQVRYNELLLKKFTRASNPALYDRIAGMQPEIKQVVIDEWKTVDRCMTCHMGIEDPYFAENKLPLKLHPDAQLLKHHPVEKFGCTICHGGQGFATTYAGAAHEAIPHWPVPVVAKSLMQSRCGICHKDFEAIGADKLIKGRALFQEMHCAGCHQIERQGGAVGPDLSAFADKDPGSFSFANVAGEHSVQNWVIEHFRDPKKVSPGSPMHLPAMNEDQILNLANYVLSLSQRNLPRQYTPKVRPGFVLPKVDGITPEAELSGAAEDAAAGEQRL